MEYIISLWAIIGTFKLIILSWQDFKKKCVDDRYNFFMIGLSFSFLAYLKPNFIYLLGISFTAPLLYIFIKKLNIFGKGDINTFTWFILGYGLISPYILAGFLIIFIAIFIFYLLIKKYIVPYLFYITGSKEFMGGFNKPLPFFPVLLIMFITTNILFKLYSGGF